MSEATNPKQADDPGSNTEKAPDDWVTGDEPMTGAQASYLKTLSEQAHDDKAFDDKLTKAEAGSLSVADVPGLYSPGGDPLAIFPFKASGMLSHMVFRRTRLTLDLEAMRLITEPC